MLLALTEGVHRKGIFASKASYLQGNTRCNLHIRCRFALLTATHAVDSRAAHHIAAHVHKAVPQPAIAVHWQRPHVLWQHDSLIYVRLLPAFLLLQQLIILLRITKQTSAQRAHPGL